MISGTRGRLDGKEGAGNGVPEAKVAGNQSTGGHMTVMNIWDRVLSRIEAKVNRHSFYTWFKPTSFVSDDGGTVRIRVPNALFRDWLTKHYSGVLAEALGEVERPGSEILFVTDEAAPREELAPSLVVPPAVEAEEDVAPAGRAPRD